MKDRTILVSAIGGDVGHSILKCLKSHQDTLLGCDMVEYPVGFDLVQRYFKVPSASSPEYIINILQICKEYKVTHFIPVSEPEIERIAKESDLFIQQNIKVIINNKNILDICLNKYKTALFIEGLGLCAPKSFIPEEFCYHDGKYIVKLNKSCGSKLLEIVSSQNEVEKVLTSTKESLIVQEYIDTPNSEYTVGVFSDGKEYRVISFKRKLQGGFTKFVELVHDESIERDVIKLSRALNLKGSINVQLRKSEGKNYIFEINPRLSGTTHFRHLLGFTDVIWWLQFLDHDKIGIYSNQYKTAIGIREMNEKFLLKGKL